ncbi:HD domain-containing protein [Marinobacterium sp. AK62]|uniref:HD domain-containing protein n=1 Tax=Marinobacterium alkalitolerans TaxID=1542925 RepID=A0ABS3Z8G1_9GAMM|nr:HD domain-containing phosphohydrolase [Marinobacterium alkalitolerans]MBP0047990.1 HD domain-containing protein [Marinobacterium alkalitolerans]
MSDQRTENSSPKRGFRLSLSLRFLVFGVGVLLLNGLLLSSKTDHIIETAFLDQADQKIHLFLDQIKRDIETGRLSPTDKTFQQEVLYLNQHEQFSSQLHVLSLYLFNREGELIAHSDGRREPKEMSPDSPYYAVINDRQPSLGDEHELNAETGVIKGDYLLPLTLPDGTEAGIEAEVDITGLTQAIGSFDAPFEQSVWVTVSLSSLLMLTVLGGLIYVRLTKPIEQLHRTISDLSSGELDQRVPVKANDEVGQLGAGVNHLADSIQRLLREQDETYMAALSSLAQALQAKDPYTAAHSGRVSRYAVRLGEAIGLSTEELGLLKKGALMHDLGKIGIHDTILNKPAALTDDEYREMQRHPVITATIMKPLKRFKAFADIAAWHHERWDGNGYPDGLAGEEIPLLARIVSIADTWDAMTGDRVYRPGMPPEKAISILEEERYSGQFDPELIGTFIEMIRSDLARGVADTTDQRSEADYAAVLNDNA